MAEPTPEQNAIYSRVLTHADRLFEALEDAEAAGGLDALTAAMKPASAGRARESLRSVRAAIDVQLMKAKRPTRDKASGRDGGGSSEAQKGEGRGA